MDIEICRICGTKEKLKFVVDEDLLEKLRLCANIQINYNDCLPKHICLQCEHGLDFSYKLRKQSEETERKLRDELLRTSSAECEVAENSEKTYPQFEPPIEFLDNIIKEMIVEEDEFREENCVEVETEALVYEEDRCSDSPVEDGSDMNTTDDYVYKNEYCAQVEEVTLDTLIEVMEDVKVLPTRSSESPKTEEHEISRKKTITSYTCGTCQLVLPTQSTYRLHIKVHGKERFQCIQCNKWFATHFTLKKHMLCHSNDIEMQQCPQCERTFRSRGNMTRHIRNSHQEKRDFKCEVCSESFGRADVLRNHMVTHILERNFACELCTESFKSQRYLESHMRTHLPKERKKTRKKTKDSDDDNSTGCYSPKKKIYHCIHCGKISKHHFTHKNHLRTHTLEKPYGCETCTKTFRTMAALITHERIHTDNRPYQCVICLVSFRQHSHLKEHQLLHEGRQPYTCNLCEMSFSKKSNLRVHMRVHTGERPYKCSVCAQEFTKLSSMKCHAKAVHGNVLEIKPLDEEEEDDMVDNVDTNDSTPNEFVENNDDQRISLEVIDDVVQYENATGDSVQISGLLPSITSTNASISECIEVDDLTEVHSIEEDSYDDGRITKEDIASVVLVIDDGAKFNSLYIMDDITTV